MFAQTAAGNVLEFLEGAVGVAVSLLNSKPTMNEQFIRTKLDDGTPVTYAVLSPGH
ncbi:MULTISPECIES: hypothetical protein [Streptomyces]|uniref:hypothetical protein n=1 Tax=Streptomyces TaxID=1883 RepID=UPI000ADDE74A|nr:hypothetical protein [Streptomyces durhamensis]